MAPFIRKACCQLFFICCFCLFTIHAQDQRVADSLSVIYKSNEADDRENLELLRKLGFNEQDPNRALQYAQELIRLAEFYEDQEYLYQGYYRKGNAHRALGDSEDALSALFTCAEIALEAKDIKLEGSSYITIGDVYSQLGNYRNSEKYYTKAIELLRASQDSILLAAAFLNAGDAYFKDKKLDKALNHITESGKIYDALNNEIGKAFYLGNMGMVHAEMGEDLLGEQNINQAIAILEEVQNYYAVSAFLTIMVDIYVRKNEYPMALEYAQRSLDLAQKYGLKEQISQANLKLFELNRQKGNFEQSIENLEKFYAYRDSVLSVKAFEEMANLRTEYEVSQKQLEVDLLNNQKRTQRIILYSLGAILLLTAVFYRRIVKEKKRSEVLLLNILPSKTAQELKDKGKVEARKYESVTVMFTDFVGFTSHSEHFNPERLVSSVDHFFSAFDEIIEKYGLEKIKTIGDAYMCTGGLRLTGPDQPVKVINAAMEILEFVERERVSDNEEIAHFEIRIGVNTGPVVAGVVGTKKFAYDIWGDTVNVAARMETNSVPGRINISENTYQLVKEQFRCEYRGEIDVKNKGMMNMYFVETTVRSQTVKNKEQLSEA